MLLIAALSDQIQKLLNERASSAVLRDHLALFKDKALDLEKQIATLHSENTILKTENSDLKLKLEKLEMEFDDLKKKIKEYDDFNKPFFHNNLYWIPNNETAYCPSCYGKDKNLVPLVTYDYQATEFHTTKRLRCPVCKFHNDVVPYPINKK